MPHSAPVHFSTSSQDVNIQSHQPQVPTKAHLDHERLMDCIHCGLCLSQCPTYAEEGLEADSPRGRIYLMRALAEGRSEPTPDLVNHLDLCLGCRNCETACPSGVQYGHLIEDVRHYLRHNYKRPWKQRIIGKVVEATFPYPERLELALLPIRVLRRFGVLPLLHRTGFMKLLGYLGDMERLLPPLPPISKRLNFAEKWNAQGEQSARVGMITGCVMQVMQTPVNEATARVLTRAGCEVHAPKSQGCCGALHAHIGGMEEAKAFAQKNIEAFEQLEKENGELDAIVINAAGCGASLKEYGGWFKGDAQWEERANKFADKVKDVSEFLVEEPFKARLQERLNNASTRKPQKGVVATNDSHNTNYTTREVLPNTAGASTLEALGQNIEDSDNNRQKAQESQSSTVNSLLSAQPSFCKHKVTYHDACHLAHGQGIRTQPRELLGEVSDLDMMPLTESEMCCGSAGVYNITQPAMAMQLLERKMKHIEKTGARIVVTGNPGCMMQLMLGAKKYNVDVEVKHPIEILDKATR